MTSTSFLYCSATEARIARKVVKAILDYGFTVSVNDGEETTLVKSSKAKEIHEAMNSTDHDILYVHGTDGVKIGFILFVWGNEEEVVSDYSDILEGVISQIL